METTVVVSVPYLKALTDPVRIEELFQQECEREKLHEGQLGAWLKEHGEVEDALKQVDACAASRLDPLCASLRAIGERCGRPAELARRVSGDVHAIDGALARVEDTVRRIEEIVDLRNSLGSVRAAMAAGEFETAAASVRRYLLLDDAVLDGHSRELLKAAQAEMRSVVTARLDDAVADADEPAIRRFCKLFPFLGVEDEGVARYTTYLRRRCSAAAEPVHRALARLASSPPSAAAAQQRAGDQGQVTVASYVDALTRICEAVAAIAQEQIGKQPGSDPLWPGSALPVLRALQSQCDQEGCRVFDLFLDRYNVSLRIAEIQGRRGTDLRVDPRELPPLLEEMTLMSQTVEIFDTFLRAREREVISALSPASPPLQAHVDPAAPATQPSPAAAAASAAPLRSPPATPGRPMPSHRKGQQQAAVQGQLAACSELSRRSQELMSSYLTLEEYIMTESTRAVLKTEELGVETVDMIFYVLQRSASRSLITSSANCVCAVLNHLVAVVSRDLFEAVTRGLRDSAPGGIRAPTSIKDWVAPQDWAQQSKAVQWGLLNCLDQSADDIAKLHESVRADCGRLFASNAAALAKVAVCLDDLLDTAKAFKASLAEGMDALVRQQVLPKLKQHFEALQAARPTYELAPLDYAQLEAGDVAFVQYGLAVEQTCKQLGGPLTPANYEGLVNRVVGQVSERVEHLILQRRFNQLGALQLDRDVRALQGQLATLARRAVREKLARLSQIAIFLNVDKVEEAAELWNSESAGRMTWRLAPAEVRRILSLRVDFSRDRIALLRL